MTYNKKSVEDIDVAGKRVLVRCDFNVPLKDGVITSDKRIVSSLPTIKYLLDNNAKVILCSHLGRPKGEVVPEFSLAPVAARLSELLGKEVKMATDVVGESAQALAASLNDGDVMLLENVRYEKGETNITVMRCGYAQTYTVPTKLIVVHVPTIYPRFDELKTELLSMSSEDGKEYERIYNIYKTIDNAEYYIGDYIVCFYKTTDDWIGKFRPCLITKLDIDAEGKLRYEATNIEGYTIWVYESDIMMRSTYEDYQRECREYEISRHNKSEEQIEEHKVTISNLEKSLHDLEGVVYKINGDLQSVNSSISISTANDGGCVRIDDNVSYNRLDVLEEKHKKTEKLLKLGISLLLGGM